MIPMLFCKQYSIIELVPGRYLVVPLLRAEDRRGVCVINKMRVMIHIQKKQQQGRGAGRMHATTYR